jgi:hypothetical protein
MEYMFEEMLIKVRSAAAKKILFLMHAVNQMNRTDRMISTLEVHNVLFSGEIIEDYPEDPRGHSCLILGFGERNRPVHVVCAPKEEYLAIITTYLPDPEKWFDGFRERMAV